MQHQNQLPSQSTCNVSKRPAKWMQREKMKTHLTKEPVLETHPETLLGTLLGAWEPCFLETLLGNLFLGTLLRNLFLETLVGNLFLGTLLENLFLDPWLRHLFLGTLLGTCSWEPRLKALPGIPGKLACKTFPGNVA